MSPVVPQPGTPRASSTTQLIDIARERGVSAFPGDGSNRWPAAHRFDAARLFRLALETAPTGTRLHAIGDQGVPTREIAEVIGRRLSLPVVSRPIEKAGEHFGWLGRFFATDIRVLGELTKQRFDWRPVELSLLEDLDHEYYFKAQGLGFRD